MESNKHSRTIALNCPTCGGTQFSSSEAAIEDAPLVTCASCGLTISKEDLKIANSENIEEHLTEISAQALEELQKEIKKSLQDAFKGHNLIKIQ